MKGKNNNIIQVYTRSLAKSFWHMMRVVIWWNIVLTVELLRVNGNMQKYVKVNYKEGQEWKKRRVSKEEGREARKG